MIHQALLAGDNRQYLVALLVPEMDELTAWADEQGLPSQTDDWLDHPETRLRLQAEIERLTTGLASFEKIKRFALIREPWTIESGEMTPTHKLRRQVILARHADAVDALYGGADPMTAEDIAETLYWVATQPPHLNFNTIELMPVTQSFAGFQVARSN